MTAARHHARRWGALLGVLALTVTLGSTTATASPSSDRTDRTSRAEAGRITSHATGSSEGIA